MRPGSLRIRLLVAAVISIAAALLAAGLALTALFERQVRERVMLELNNDLLQLVGAIEVSATGEIAVVHTLADPRYEMPYGGKYWRIVRLEPAPVAASQPLRSRSYWDNATDDSKGELGPEGETLVSSEKTVTIGSEQGDVILQLRVSVHAEEVSEPLASFRNQLFLYLSLIGLCLTLAAWVQVSVGLRPMQALRAQLSSLRSSRTRRLEGSFPTEVAPLVAEFNDVLDQRDKSLERARKRAGDLAHGLMTPLAVLSVIARELRKRKLAKLGREIDGQIDGMRRHVDRGLVRARLSTGRGRDQTNLAEAIDSVVETLRRLPADRDILWANGVPPGTMVPLERNDLLELLGNLLDNARKFAASRVEIGFAERTISIEDDGSGVAEVEHSNIFERGHRLDESTRGFGLGLAIVSDIADLYEIKLIYGRSPLGGLRVSLFLEHEPNAAPVN